MIDPDSLEKWMNRPLLDSATAKRFTRGALDRKLARVDPPPRFELRPYDHQLVAFLLAIRNPGYFLALDMGTGKTAVVANVFRWRQDRGEAHRMLVLVPSTSNIDEWRLELDKHAPELRVALLDGKARGAEARSTLFWDLDVDVVVVTYRGFLVMMTESKDKRLQLSDAQFRKIGGHFQMMVADESTAVANPDAITTKALRRLATKVPYRICMSGTPSTTDPMGLWAQFKITDGGATLGKSIGVFKAAFFIRSEGQYAIEYKLRRRDEPKLHRMLRSGSIRYEASECLSLPTMTGGIADPMIRAVRMSRVQVRHVMGLEAEMDDARVDDDAEGVENIYLRMRALSSGWLPTDDAPIDFKDNPKLDALMQLMDEAPTEKWFVVIHYKHTADLIIKALRRASISYAEVSGRISDKAKQLAMFRSDARVLVGSKAALLGLNLQHCSRMAFFETPDMIDFRRQGERRIHRMGQARPCFVYDLVMRGTYDMRIIDALREGKRVQDAIVDGVEKVGAQHAVFA